MAGSLGKAQKQPNHVVTNKGRNPGLNSTSTPATPRSADLGTATTVTSSGDSSMSPTALKNQQQATNPFSSQEPEKVIYRVCLQKDNLSFRE